MVQGGAITSTSCLVSLWEGTRMQKATVGHRALVGLISHTELHHLSIFPQLRDPLRATFAALGKELGLTLPFPLVIKPFRSCSFEERSLLWFRQAGTQLQQTRKLMSNMCEFIQRVVHGPISVKHQVRHLLPNMTIRCLAL